jgi:transcriptional regulator with XRE-family HTH domain
MEEARRPNERLRRARVLRGWSQQRVADQINQLPGNARADRELVYRWEAGYSG